MGSLTQRAVGGDIRSRQELLRHVRELGLEVPQAGKSYITIREPRSEQRDYSKPDERAARTVQSFLKGKDREPSRGGRFF